MTTAPNFPNITDIRITNQKQVIQFLKISYAQSIQNLWLSCVKIPGFAIFYQFCMVSYEISEANMHMEFL